MEISEGDLANYLPPAKRHFVSRYTVSNQTFWTYSGPAPGPEELGALPLLSGDNYIHLNDAFYTVAATMPGDPGKVDYAEVVLTYISFWGFLFFYIMSWE